MSNEYFENTLNQAIQKMENRVGEEYHLRKGYFEIYPFTTENILGYIKEFNLYERTLLTVGSSSDQVINAILFGCTKPTICDICPFTKYYFYLKKAGIMALDYNEFLNYFCYIDYPEVFKDNEKVFNLEGYKKIEPILRLLDYESFLFWDELFKNYPAKKVRDRLFKRDEVQLKVLRNINLYLKDETYFNKTKQAIRNIEPNFIIGNINSIDKFNIYDNIFLSNIVDVNGSRKQHKILVDKLNKCLSEEGTMLLTYLYETEEKTKYDKNWAPIYNLPETKELFKEYITEFISFTSITGYLLKTDKIKDSALIYKKIKK